MKTAIIMLVAGLALAACSPDVGYVNMRKVFDESETGKAAKAEIQRSTAGAKQAAEEARTDYLKAGNGPLSEDALTGKRQRAAQLANDYQKAHDDADALGVRVVVAKVRLAVDRVSADRRVGLVLPAGSDAPLHGGIDLTDDVIKRLDQARGAEPVAIGDGRARERQAKP